MGYVRTAVLAFVFVTTAFAGLNDILGTYKGTGVWKSPDGESGTFSHTTSLTKNAQGIEVKDLVTLRFDGHPSMSQNQSSEWVAVIKEDRFFHIEKKGSRVGWGHCFDWECQIVMPGAWANTTSTETIRFTRTGAVRHGQDTVVWRGTAKKQ